MQGFQAEEGLGMETEMPLLRIFSRATKQLRSWISADPHVRLKIEERLSLGAKKSLLLVACDGHQFLVATGADTIAGIVELSGRPACSGAPSGKRTRDVGRPAGGGWR